MLQESCNKKWNDGNWSYKPSFAVNDICWLISLYFTSDHVTRKGNWPIEQVLYLPAFFLVPPLTILTMHCMPFPWFQWLCLPDNIKAQGGSPRKSSQYTLDGACWNVLGNCTAQKKSTLWKWLLLRRCYFMPCGWSLAPQNFKLRNASCLSLPLGFSSSHFEFLVLQLFLKIKIFLTFS